MPHRPLFTLSAAQLNASQAELGAWYKTETGRKYLAVQKDLFRPWAQQMFGYHLLQISVCSGVQLFDEAMVRHKAGVTTRLTDQDESGACIDPEALPFAEASIDVVVLHHVHEYITQPHALLREAYRVLAPHGYLVVFGFNPLSLWGLYTLMHRGKSRTPWCKHLITPKRVEDWLTLLDFDIQALIEGSYLPSAPQYHYHRSLRYLETLARRLRLPGGSAYMVVARKEIPGLTPTRRALRSPIRMTNLPLAKPSALGYGDSGTPLE